jgi:hypothetical protein
MPLDPASLDTDTPRTLDHRSYPEHLKAYEGYDRLLLQIAMELTPFTRESLEGRLQDAKVRDAVPRWLASAEWRGLIKRESTGRRDPPNLHVDMQRAHRRLGAISRTDPGAAK